MSGKATEDRFSDEETARRRDEVIKRMIDTPPRPHKPLGKANPKPDASPKKRDHAPKIKDRNK